MKEDDRPKALRQKYKGGQTSLFDPIIFFYSCRFYAAFPAMAGSKNQADFTPENECFNRRHVPENTNDRAIRRV
ncbi:MAG: hypothetical protein LBV44_02940 [Methylobacillus sp.]|nr:hypothetical protein [Methylobacillus sp.]